VTPLELRDLQALAYIRRGRVQQVIRVPPVRERSRPWYLVLDGTYADESNDPAAAILAVGNLATHWKANAGFSPPEQLDAAGRRDLEALRRLRDGEVQQLVWIGERHAFLAFGTHGTAEDVDPADAIIKATAIRVEPSRIRRR
jgi:hypothetical protein